MQERTVLTALLLLKFNDDGLCESADVDEKTTTTSLATVNMLLACLHDGCGKKLLMIHALSKALEEAKRRGSDDRGSIGTGRKPPRGLLEAAASSKLTGALIEKGYSGRYESKTGEFAAHCLEISRRISALG